MYTSQQQTTGTRITSVSKEWRGREEDLRRLGQSDELVCQYCRELVTFRSGEINRPHLAHRQDTKCPLTGNRSPQEIEAKAQLYEALEHTWCDEVQMDVMLEGESQPIDILLLKNVDLVPGNQYQISFMSCHFCDSNASFLPKKEY